MSKVILACRNESKAKDAVTKLAEETGKPESFFEIVICDVSNITTCRSAVESIKGKVDRVILNAGGMPPKATEIQENGVTTCFAQNVLGHAVLLEGLIAASKLNTGARVVFSGSEGALGMVLGPVTISAPVFASKDADGVDMHLTGAPGEGGKPFKQDEDVYASAKGIGALYIGAMARKHPKYHFATVSPGMTHGTDVVNKAPFPANLLFSFMMWIFNYLGKAHDVSFGCKRYVDQVMGKQDYPTGCFLASPEGATGDVANVTKIEKHAYYADTQLQDAAYEAVHRHTK